MGRTSSVPCMIHECPVYKDTAYHAWHFVPTLAGRLAYMICYSFFSEGFRAWYRRASPVTIMHDTEVSFPFAFMPATRLLSVWHAHCHIHHPRKSCHACMICNITLSDLSIGILSCISFYFEVIASCSFPVLANIIMKNGTFVYPIEAGTKCHAWYSLSFLYAGYLSCMIRYLSYPFRRLSCMICFL